MERLNLWIDRKEIEQFVGKSFCLFVSYPKERPFRPLSARVTISYPAFSYHRCGGEGWVGVSLGWSIGLRAPRPNGLSAPRKKGCSAQVHRLLGPTVRDAQPNTRQSLDPVTT